MWLHPWGKGRHGGAEETKDCCCDAIVVSTVLLSWYYLFSFYVAVGLVHLSGVTSGSFIKMSVLNILSLLI